MSEQSALESNNDQWFIDRQHTIDPLKLHAIGWIMLHWQTAEDCLQAVFSTLIGVTPEVGRAITHKMGDTTLSDAIKDVVNAKINRDEFPEFSEQIEHLLKDYEICRINRNFIAHATLSTTDQGNRLMRTKGRNGKEGAKGVREPLDDSLERIREVGDDISRLCYRLSSTYHRLFNQPDFSLVSWPEKPKLPTFLHIPPPKSRQSPRNQRQSSPA